MKTFSYTAHSKQVLGDMHTPVSIYLKVRDMYPQSALMESSDYHAGENSLSFIALCPLASIGVNSGIVTASYPDNSRKEEPLTQSFTVEKAMNQFISQFQVTGENKNVCGLYGYTTFNAVKYFEHIPVKESHDEQNDAPDLLYILYKYIIVFNHFKNELTLVEMLGEGEESGLPELEAAIENRNYASYNFSVTGPVSSPISDEEHKANVRKGIAHCMRGDVFRLSFPEDSSSLMPEMISKSIVLFAASTLLLIFSISISEDTAFSVLLRRLTVKLKTDVPTSTRLPEQPAVPEIR